MQKLSRTIIALLACTAVLWSGYALFQTLLDYRTARATRSVVEGFEELAFVQRRPRDATLRFISAAVIDHNPDPAGSRDSILMRLEKLDWHIGGPQRYIKHFVVEGEYAVVHHHLIRKPGERGIAAVDKFRVHDGLIMEHWDVLQPLPESSVNPKPMF